MFKVYVHTCVGCTTRAQVQIWNNIVYWRNLWTRVSYNSRLHDVYVALSKGLDVLYSEDSLLLQTYCEID